MRTPGGEKKICLAAGKKENETALESQQGGEKSSLISGEGLDVNPERGGRLPLGLLMGSGPGASTVVQTRINIDKALSGTMTSITSFSLKGRPFRSLLPLPTR